MDEINYLSCVGYQYQQRSPNIATNYCGFLRKEQIETFPYQTFFISKYDPDAIQELFKFLSPDRVITQIVAQNSDKNLDRKEKWMGAKYTVFDPTTQSRLLPLENISYPRENPFVPNDLKLLDHGLSGDILPQKLPTKESAELYYYPDNEFGVPESCYIFTIKSPSIRPGDAKSQCLLALFIR